MENLKPTIQAISYSITYDEKGMRDLLKRNGVNASLVKTRKGLTNLFIDSLAVSKGLAVDFTRYMNNQLNSFSNVNGSLLGVPSSDFSTNPYFDTTTSIEDLAGSKTDTVDVTTDKKTNKPSFFDWVTTIGNTGLKALELQVRLQESKDNVQAVKEIADNENQKLGFNPTVKASSNMVTFVIIGVVAVALVGGIIYYYNKK